MVCISSQSPDLIRSTYFLPATARRNSSKFIGDTSMKLTLPTGNESLLCMAIPSSDPAQIMSYSGAFSQKYFSDVIPRGAA